MPTLPTGPSAEASQSSQPVEPEIDPAIPIVPIDIFVVDDEETITQFISEILEEQGYRVTAFHDGSSAFNEIIHQPPRLVLLDIGLPLMTGDKVLEAIRNQGLIALPVIMMSANTALQRFYSAGTTDILPKPFDIATLLAQVHSYIPL